MSIQKPNEISAWKKSGLLRYARALMKPRVPGGRTLGTHNEAKRKRKAERQQFTRRQWLERKYGAEKKVA